MMQQQPQEKVFNVDIQESDMQKIGLALENLPYKEAAPVIARLQQQINVQLQQEQQAAEAAQGNVQAGQEQQAEQAQN